MDKFSITIADYIDKEGLIAEIFYDSYQWVEISQKGEELLVEFFSHPKQESWKFSCDEALKYLDLAKIRLLKKLSGEKSLFPPPPQSPEEANAMGQQLLEDIVSHPQAKFFQNRFKGVDIFEPSGRGARYNKKKEFLGFLQARGKLLEAKGFEVIISSDIEYEDLCSEIYFDGEFIRMIHQENGVDHPVFDLASKQEKKKKSFDFFALIKVLKKAQTEI